jgi:2-aminomuconate deaminase
MSTPNGTPYFLPSNRAQGLANYPHPRLYKAPTQTIHVSGTSARRGDGTHEGVTKLEDGPVDLDIREQTAAVLRNISRIIEGATDGKGGLANVVDATVFLTDMRSCYSGMNEEWNKVWPDRAIAPARTTVEVRALPNPALLVEIKCTAIV